jgi:monoamine oxidase
MEFLSSESGSSATHEVVHHEAPAFSFRALFTRRLMQQYRANTTSLTELRAETAIRTDKADLRVGIVGAGMAGMYAALLLQDLGIQCYILEANRDRVGGRVYTYRFNPEDWAKANPGEPAYYDYVDVGAMRIPKLDIMERLCGHQPWSLLNFLNTKTAANIKLIDYTFSMKQNVQMYNGIRLTKAEVVPNSDAFHFGSSHNGGPGTAVPDCYTEYDYDHWLGIAIEPYLEAMKVDFNSGFDNLMTVDTVSTRAYLLGLLNNNKPLPPSVINWMETMDTGTGLYDKAFSETVMDAFDFTGAEDGWKCVEGGMDRFTTALADYLRATAAAVGEQKSQQDDEGTESDEDASPAYTSTSATTSTSTSASASASASTSGHCHGHCADIIRQGIEVGGIAPMSQDLLMVSATTTSATGTKSEFQESFHHVINTAPLSIQRNMDMSQCSLNYGQLEALRCMHYDFSDKVCLKFKSRFWEKEEFGGILGGQSTTDNILRTIVYPSYGMETEGAPGVLIASYTWAQDASRMGALCGGSGKNHTQGAPEDNNQARRDAAIEICLDNLAQIHGSVVREEYIGEYFVMDWYTEQYAHGAFALYGPTQFTQMFPQIVQPAASGRLHFAGEATSVHHAWIVGALNSAYRSVYEILDYEGLSEEKLELVARWGLVDECDYGDFASMSGK